MNSAPEPFRVVLQWLTSNASFPARRLPTQAEKLVCVAALAAAEEFEGQGRYSLQGHDSAQAAALRAHGLRRSQVHYKSDNSAKV
jgi:hypothetical protein